MNHLYTIIMAAYPGSSTTDPAQIFGIEKHILDIFARLLKFSGH